MRNRVVIITSRFGTLSDFFDLWLESASKNKAFDFLILTDIDIKCETDNILLVKYKSFEQFIKEVDRKIGFKTGITTPFKTADLRPAYAYLFKDILKKVYSERYIEDGEYDFWGYIDTDMIIGNLSHFIDDDILDKCDVFQTWGHFTLIRNKEMFNQLYNKPYKSYLLKESLRLPENCMVEEGPFILQLKAVGARIDSRVSRIADIKRNVFNFTVDGCNYENQRFIYHNGEVRRVIEINGKISVVDEFMYIHFMKRIIENIPNDCTDLILNENGFVAYNKETVFQERFSQKAYDNWAKFTCASTDIRYKKTSIAYKLAHLNNWIYRRKTRGIEIEKRELIREYYGL